MFELVQVAQSTYYIESPAKIGLVKLNDRDVCLIDSGNDKDAGRKVRQILDANGWHLTAIYNTHANADHIACTGRRAAKFTRRALIAPLRATRCWNRRFCTAAIPARICGTSF